MKFPSTPLELSDTVPRRRACTHRSLCYVVLQWPCARLGATAFWRRGLWGRIVAPACTLVAPPFWSWARLCDIALCIFIVFLRVIMHAGVKNVNRMSATVTCVKVLRRVLARHVLRVFETTAPTSDPAFTHIAAEATVAPWLRYAVVPGARHVVVRISVHSALGPQCRKQHALQKKHNVSQCTVDGSADFPDANACGLPSTVVSLVAPR